ncbi:MAG: exo-alpha-sialidase [Planctomycetes bacterium]|nr:exo-alpha-sialidase [Planctomycetota bacterium]
MAEIDSPAGLHSSVPNLVRGDDGKVYLSWIELDAAANPTLRFSVWQGGGWSRARTIAAGEDWFVNWADFPSMAVLADGTLAAHWLAKSGPDTYAYDVNIVISRDGGESWSDPIVPHRDGVQTEHGFVSMVPLTPQRLGLFWLDGREMAGEGHAAGGDMALRFTTLDADGTLGLEQVVDSRVCECCQTDAVRTMAGDVILVYRDRSPLEVRDIGIARLSGGEISDPEILHADNWRIKGCPVNGPAIDAGGTTVAVAWFTQSSLSSTHVRLAISRDGGRSFGDPIPIDEGHPLGRVAVLVLPDHSVLVAWLESAEEGAEIRIRIVRPDGAIEQSFAAAPTRRSRASGFPQLALVGDQVLLAWTDASDGSRVRTARINIP